MSFANRFLLICAFVLVASLGGNSYAGLFHRNGGSNCANGECGQAAQQPAQSYSEGSAGGNGGSAGGGSGATRERHKLFHRRDKSSGGSAGGNGGSAGGGYGSSGGSGSRSGGSAGGYGSAGGNGGQRLAQADDSGRCTCPNCGATFDCPNCQRAARGTTGCGCCDKCTGRPGCPCGCPDCTCNSTKRAARSDGELDPSRPPGMKSVKPNLPPAER